jgi:hypothetical protein
MSAYDGIRIQSAEDLRHFQAVVQHIRRESINEVLGFSAASQQPMLVNVDGSSPHAVTIIHEVRLIGDYLSLLPLDIHRG